MTDSRLLRLSEAHVRPLMELIEQWRRSGLNVPNVDPNDGGINAKALFLLESPGPRAVRTGFVSRDNPDPSARNMGTLLDKAGFRRSEVLLWNVVPYCVATEERNKNATARQIREAVQQQTQAFLNLLPNLRSVVFCGRRAQKAEPYVSTNAKRFLTFHPGAMAYNHLSLREDMRCKFLEARRNATGLSD